MSISLIHKNASADVTGTAQAYAIASTAAGNLLVVTFNFRSGSGDTISSITNGGDTFVSANCRSVQSSGRVQEIWYCLNLSAGKTSLTINQSGVGIITVSAIEYHSTLGLYIFDVSGATPTNGSVGGTGIDTGPTIVTTGASDLVVHYCVTSGNWLTANSPFTAQQGDAHGNEICDIQGRAAGSVTYTGTEDTTTGFISQGTVAFSEQAGAVTTVPNNDELFSMMYAYPTQRANRLFLQYETADSDGRGIALGQTKTEPRVPFSFVDEGAETRIDVQGGGGKMTPDWFNQYESADSDGRGIALGQTRTEPRVPFAFENEAEAKFDSNSIGHIATDDPTARQDEPGLLGRPIFSPNEDEFKFEVFVPTFLVPDDSDSTFVQSAAPVVISTSSDDLEVSFRVSDHVTLDDLSARSDEPGFIGTPPAAIFDDVEISKWSATAAPIVEDDQSNAAPTPPQVIPDDADSMQWVDKRSLQHDDLESHRAYPPPPAQFDDPTIELWAGYKLPALEDDQSNSAPTPPLADDPEIEKMVAGPSLQHDDTETQSNYPVAQPIVAPNIGLDDFELGITVSWKAPFIEDDQTNQAPAPPPVIPDDADSMQWVDKRFLQHDDLESHRAFPPPPAQFDDPEIEMWAGYRLPALEDDQSNQAPAPPQVIPDDADSSIWTGQRWIQYDDTESHRAYPPPPAQFDDPSIEMWAGYKLPAIEDDQSNSALTPPQVIPDDADSVQWVDRRFLQYDDTESHRAYPPPPAQFDDPEIELWTGYARPSIEDDQRNSAPTPPPVIPDDADSMVWTDKRFLQHDDLETHQSFPPPPAQFDDPTIEVWTGYLRPALEDDQRNSAPTPPFVIPDDADSSIWTGKRFLQHDDLETHQSFPPPPAQFDDPSIEMWAGYRLPALEDDHSNFAPRPPFAIQDEYEVPERIQVPVQPDDSDSNYPVTQPIIAPNIGLDDIEVHIKAYGRVVPIQEDDARNSTPTPPVADDSEVSKWTGYQAPIQEDDARALPPTPPPADDSEMSKWAATSAIQHDDTDTQSVAAPVPPTVFQEEPIEKWTAWFQLYQDDAETQRAFPPTPAFVGQEEYEFLSGIQKAQPIEIDSSAYPVIPPIIAPNIGLDNIESLMRALDRIIPFYEDSDQTKTPTPPPAPVDESEQAKQFSWKATYEPDVEVQRNEPPIPPPTTQHDEYSETWRAWLQAFHSDLETQRALPPPPPTTASDEIIQWSVQKPILPAEDLDVLRQPDPPIVQVDDDKYKFNAAWSATRYDHTAESDLPGTLNPPPVSQQDMAEISQWVEKRFIQYEDTDTMRGDPPTPPTAFQDDGEFAVSKESSKIYFQPEDDARWLIVLLHVLYFKALPILSYVGLARSIDVSLLLWTAQKVAEALHPQRNPDMLPASMPIVESYGALSFATVEVYGLRTIEVEQLEEMIRGVELLDESENEDE